MDVRRFRRLLPPRANDGLGKWVPGMVVVAIAFGLFAVACTLGEDIPPLERRAQEIDKVVMCPVCPGESIDQSQNALAKQMRAIVVEKLEQGWTGEQIKEFFVERYGPSVLLEPPRRGFNLLAWTLPPAGVAAAGLALYFALRSMRRPQATELRQEVHISNLSEEERAEYFRRIEAALGDEGGGAQGRRDGGDSLPGPETKGIVDG